MERGGVSPRRRLGELLTDQGLIGVAELERALVEQRRRGGRLGEALVDLKLLSEGALAQSLSRQLGYPYLDLKQTEVSPEALLLVPESLAKKYLMVPVDIDRKMLTVAMVDPLAYEAINDLVFYCGYTVRPVIATKQEILIAIDRYYRLETPVQDLIEAEEAIFPSPSESVHRRPEATLLEDQSQQAPAVRLVNLILGRAIRTGASDIHIEPTRGELSVRFRVDGLLRREMALPKWSHGPLSSRVKVLARLDIAERRMPQDGSFRVCLEKQEIDIRVATLPTQFGEKVVMRILDQSQRLPSLEGLELSGVLLERLRRLLAHRSGILLVTGPTGSGKTTTLYAMIQALKGESTNIVTVEDPIEYSIEGINQTQVQPEIGLTFSHCLRSILRQDPNIILLGEIRDLETAEIAFRAAMTGHLVLSTLHTRDAASSVTRLMDLGIPPYLVASLLVGVVAQRLVRSLCTACRIEETPSSLSLMRFGLSRESAEPFTFYRGKGCTGCQGQGFRGRVGLFEVMELTPRLREMVLQKASEAELRGEAVAQGMFFLGEEGLKRVKKGETSLDELLRVIEVEDHLPILCEGCGESLSPYFRVCPFCSLPLASRCKSCGKSLRAEWKVCPYCSDFRV